MSKELILTKKQKKRECETIIRRAMGMAFKAGSELAFEPLIDNSVIAPIQISMIIELGNVCGREITKADAENLLSENAISIIERGFLQISVGRIPGIGKLINSITAANATKTLGRRIACNFLKD